MIPKYTSEKLNKFPHSNIFALILKITVLLMAQHTSKLNNEIPFDTASDEHVFQDEVLQLKFLPSRSTVPTVEQRR
jgi:hypothetical protein